MNGNGRAAEGGGRRGGVVMTSALSLYWTNLLSATLAAVFASSHLSLVATPAAAAS